MAKVGIIGAMDVEVELICKQLEELHVERRHGSEFNIGLLEGVPTVVAMCGDGKVNAALCAHTLINAYGVSCVINTGIAGALDKRLSIGDFVVSTDAVEHDMDVTGLGYAPGLNPYLDIIAFPADLRLRKLAMEAIREIVPNALACEGRIASGDQFVCTEETRSRIVDQFGAACCEMEGAAIAHTCYLADVPYVVIRVISDDANSSSSMDYPTFKLQTSHLGAGVVRAMVAKL